MERLAGKTAIITGAAGGLGRRHTCLHAVHAAVRTALFRRQGGHSTGTGKGSLRAL